MTISTSRTASSRSIHRSHRYEMERARYYQFLNINPFAGFIRPVFQLSRPPIPTTRMPPPNSYNSLDLVTRIRLVLSVLLLSALLIPGVFQPFPTWLCGLLKTSRVYSWSTFETLWTVFCYATIEVPLTVVFINHPCPDPSHTACSRPPTPTPRP